LLDNVISEVEFTGKHGIAKIREREIGVIKNHGLEAFGLARAETPPRTGIARQRATNRCDIRPALSELLQSGRRFFSKQKLSGITPKQSGLHKILVTM